MSDRNAFQSLGTMIEKALLPMRVERERKTSKWEEKKEQRSCLLEYNNEW